MSVIWSVVYSVLAIIFAMFLVSTIMLCRQLGVYRCALTTSISNETFCNQAPGSCLLQIRNGIDPSSDAFLADLIARVEIRGVNCTKDVYLPPGVSLVKNLTTSSGNLFRGIIAEQPSMKRYIVVFKGSTTQQEINEDLRFAQQAIDQEKLSENVYVHSGFLDAFNSIKCIFDQVDFSKYPETVCTGHSLGGALAQLSAIYINQKTTTTKPKLTIVNFGTPRVGNPDYSTLLISIVQQFRSYQNELDVVPTLPFSVMPNFQCPKKPFLFDQTGQIIRFSSPNRKSLLENHMMPVYQEYFDSQ